MIDQAMLMAAGIGSRMRPFTALMPKPFLPFFSIPIIQFTIDSLAEHGVKKFVINIHHLPSLARALVEKLDFHGGSVFLSDESAELLGSAGGLRHAMEFFGRKPFFAVNTDVMMPLDWRALSSRHERLRDLYAVGMTLAIVPPRRQTPYREIQIDVARERVEAVGEVASGKPFYSGMAVIEPEALQHLKDGEPSDFRESILNPWVMRRRVGVFDANGTGWTDLGEPTHWAEAHFCMMEELERNQREPTWIPPVWAERIKTRNMRVSASVWAESSWAADLARCRAESPFYFGRSKEYETAAPGSRLALAPSDMEVGPRFVQYGAFNDSSQPIENGIYFYGVSATF